MIPDVVVAAAEYASEAEPVVLGIEVITDPADLARLDCYWKTKVMTSDDGGGDDSELTLIQNWNKWRMIMRTRKIPQRPQLQRQQLLKSDCLNPK